MYYILSKNECLSVTGGFFSLPSFGLPSLGDVVNKSVMYTTTAIGGIVGGGFAGAAGHTAAFGYYAASMGPGAAVPAVITGGIGFIAGFPVGAFVAGTTTYYGGAIVSGVVGLYT